MTDAEEVQQLLNPVNPAAPPGDQDARDVAELMRVGRPAPVQAQHVHSLWDALKAGAETSVTGLAVRQRAPEQLMVEDPTRWERIAAFAGQTIGDLPTLVAGGFVGGLAGAPGGPTALVTGGAGALGLTEGARTWMLEQYKQGVDRQSLADRITATAWATTKGAVVGGVTGPAGAIGGKLAGPIAATAAEIATMTTVSRALEGQLPTANDFMDAAILLGGLKSANVVAGKLMEIYRKTGKTPQEIVVEAARDPLVHEQLVDTQYDAIPDTIKPLERPSETAPDLAEVIRQPVPGSMPEDPIFSAIANSVPSSENAQLLQARYAEVFEKEFIENRGGRIGLIGRAQAAMDEMNRWVGPNGMVNVPEHVTGTAENYALIMARRTALYKTYENLADKAVQAFQRGDDETLAGMVVALDNVRLQEKWLAGASAEASRSLAAFQKLALDATLNRAKTFKMIIDQFGGTEAAKKAAEMLDSIKDNPAALARAARKSTTFEKFMGAWKMGLISGFRTQEVNFLGNLAYLGTRMSRDTMAGTLGTLFRTEQGIRLGDVLGMYIGTMKGAIEGSKLVGSIYKAGLQDIFANKAAGDAAGIPVTADDLFGKVGAAPDKTAGVSFTSRLGKAADLLTFKTLGAMDALFRTMNSRGEAYMQAMRNMRLESDLKFGAPGYWEAVDQLVNNPTTYIQGRMKTMGDRGVFQEREAGGVVAAIQEFKRSHPWLNILVPFDQTPGAIFRESARLSPFSPFVKKWREDFAAGGERQQRAMVEWMSGSALALGTWYLATNKSIIGLGAPSPSQRAAERAAGQLPYSFYWNGTYYQYSRIGMPGVLLGLVADLHSGWHLLETPEKEKAWATVGFAFANAVVNQTWMKGVSDAINALSDPGRGGAHWAEAFAGSMVPGVLGNTASAMDPYVRDVNSVLDAVYNKVPGLRAELPPRYDIFGEPAPNVLESKVFNPISTSQVSPDKVRTEAARLGYAGPVTPGPAPTSLPIAFPSRPADARLQMTDAQREQFAQTAGKQAYSVLAPSVNSPAWDQMPDFAKRLVYQKAFRVGRFRAGLESVPVEQRAAAIGQLQQEYLGGTTE